MVLNFPLRALRSIPTLGGIAAAGLAAMAALLLPDWRFEQLVVASGLPDLLPWAQPPLGWTARLLLAFAGAVIAGAVAWSALFLIWGPGGWLEVRERDESAPPAVRRADAHPDAPPRWPLSAAELGSPPGPPTPAPQGRAIPADLDQPLAAFDPRAILPVPREPVRPVAPISVADVASREPDEQPDSDAFERIETFELTPMVRTPEPVVEPEAPQTIEMLLARLERSAGRRPARG